MHIGDRAQPMVAAASNSTTSTALLVRRVDDFAIDFGTVILGRAPLEHSDHWAG